MSIRPAEEKDLSAMLEIYRPYVEETTVSFEYKAPSMESFRRRFLDHTAQFPWLVWEEQGKILGYAYAGAPWERAAYRWCAEISIYLRKDCRGRGLGSRLLPALEGILQKQGYRILYALITSENTGSIRFHERMGYRFACELPACGYKMGRWLGVQYLEKRLEQPAEPGDFPLPWTELEEKP